MLTNKEIRPKFVICIDTGGEELLTPRRIYEVMNDEDAEKSNHLRIIDDEGEDYLYPAKYFISVDFTLEISQAIQKAA